MAHYGLGDASQQKPLNASASMTAHHNEISRQLFAPSTIFAAGLPLSRNSSGGGLAPARSRNAERRFLPSCSDSAINLSAGTPISGAARATDVSTTWMKATSAFRDFASSMPISAACAANALSSTAMRIFLKLIQNVPLSRVSANTELTKNVNLQTVNCKQKNQDDDKQ